MTFFACFDECGDEGFTFRGDGIKASSEWFILAAAVQIGQGTTPWITQHYADFRTKYRKQDKWHFHSVDASHDERLGFIEHMRVAPYACMAVAVHKPSLLLTDAFKKPFYLYFYTARLLLERVSWFCHFNKPADDAGSGKASLIFSSRRGLRVEDIDEYLNLLRSKADERGLYADLAHNKIHWPALERGVELRQNKELIGL